MTGAIPEHDVPGPQPARLALNLKILTARVHGGNGDMIHRVRDTAPAGGPFETTALPRHVDTGDVVERGNSRRLPEKCIVADVVLD